MRLAHKSHRRTGFTLVELMVAAALTILIMTVLATGFQMALDSFRTLKAAGDLSERIRTAETLLRRDLVADHLEGEHGNSPRVSDFRFDRSNTPQDRPLGGFFQIRQGGASTLEGGDQDNLSSTTAANHSLSMTVRQSGKSAGDLFATALVTTEPMAAGATGIIATNPTDVAQVPNLYLGEWAEVHWFLDSTRAVNVNGVNTFPLVRRVRLLTRNPVTGAAANNPTLPEVVSTFVSSPGNLTTNTPATVAVPANRLNGGGAPTALPAGSNRFGDDIVITNVLSFEVKPTWEVAAGGPVPQTSVGPVGAVRVNADYPFADFPLNNLGPAPQVNALFDTSLGGFQPAAGGTVQPARLTGVQIKIRIYDGKNKMTRQSTVSAKL